MLRRVRLVLLAILTIGLLVPPGWGPARFSSAQAAGENLIQNSSFETYTTDSQAGWTTRRAANWGIWVDTASTPVAPTVTVELYHSSAGSRSVKISSPAPNKSRLTVYQGNIPVVPGQEYRLSGAFKTQQINGDTSAYGINIRVAYLDPAGQLLRMDYLLPSNKPVRGNNTNWVSYETSTIAPAGSATARVDLDYNKVTGNAWFDDIQFKPWTSLKGLSFQEQGTMIPVGGTKQAPVQLAPANPSNPSLSWASSAPGVATVDGQGTITGVAPGLATITATSAEGGYTASYLVTVAPAGLVKNSGFETVTSGSQNGFTDKTPSFWSALTPYGSPVVTVDEAVYGAGSRSLSISAAVNSNASAVQYNMPVTEGNWYRWSSLIATESLTGTGASLRLKWNGSGGTAISTEYLPATAVKGTQPWKSYEGLVQAPLGATGASLYANYDKAKGQAWFDDVQLTPWIPVTGLTGDVPSYQALSPGESVTHAVYAAPSNATDRRVYWSSSQPEVAAVDASGKVSAKAAGQTVITAASAEGGWTKSYTVIVSAAFPNGGFETTVATSSTDWLNGTKPGTWINYFGTGTHPQLSLDSTVKKEGAKSLKIEASSQGKAVLYNNIVGAAAGKSYRVGGWLKQENGGTNVSLRLVYQDDNNAIISKDGNVYEKLPAIGTTGADGWGFYEKIVTVPAGATKARLEVAFELGTGTLWADDIQVIPWIPASGIQLDKNKGLIGVGESVALTATALPANATNPVVSWESKNEAVAVVEANGTDPSKATVRGIAPGIATISVKAIEDPHVYATYAVVVGTDSDITASDETVEVNEDQSISRPILATDAAGDPLTASVLLAPSHGTVAARDDGTWTYYPNAEYNGADTFTLLIADGHDHFAFSVIQVNVGSQQDAPSMDKLQVNVGTVRDQVLSGRVTAKDKDGDPLTFALQADPASQPQHGGAAVQSNGDWTYTPAAGYTGYDSFQIGVSDGHGGTSGTKIVVYVGLPGADMIASLVSRHSAPGTAHPRLFATSDDFTSIRGLIQTDPIMQEWYAKVKADADLEVPKPSIQYYTTSSGSNINIVNLADELRPRIEKLALMYQLTGDTKYSVPAINQLNVMVDYPDWHGGVKNFLSISEMGVVASIGYDWLYDAMTQQERDSLRAKMIQEVLINAKYEYLEGGAKNNAWWTVSPSNWNLVVNGGIVTTVLAIGDEADANRVHTEASDPRFQVPIAESVLESALSSTQYGLGAFATDGDWPEGTGYWNYATEYFAYMMSALHTTLGTDYGFMDQAGVRETAKYMANLHGPKGPFNYADAHPTILDTPQLLLFADLLEDPDVSWYRQFSYKENHKALPMDLIWYRPGLYGASVDPQQLDVLYDHPLKNNVAAFRDSWSDPGANYVAIKGGVNDYAITNTLHNHLDVGTFVLDALGVRWAVDLGKDDKDYNVQGYFTSNPEADPNRWDWYRTRAEGSNTLVINPDDGPDQALDANAPIIAYDSKPEGGYAVVDMTSAYKDDVVYAKRGMMLGQYRSSFLLQDELQLKAPSDLYWFMHTDAPEITVAPDGKSAILTKNGKRLYAQLLSPGAATFEVRTATPLPTTDSYAGQTLNANVRKLTIHIPAAKDQLTIAVRFTPLSVIEAPPADVPAVTPLQAWSLDSTPTALLSQLKVDGVPVAGFRSLKMKYAVEVPFLTQTVPAITAVAADPNDTVTITPASGIPGTAVVEVTDDQGVNRPGKYLIDITRGIFSGVLTDVPALPVTYLADSGPVDNQWPGPRAADHDLTTYWSVSGPNTIDFDLGSETTATYVGISWRLGNQRQFYFDLLTSTDGQTWTKVYQGPSSGKVTDDYEIYDIPDTTARYLRIAVSGNNLSTATSIMEVMVYSE